MFFDPHVCQPSSTADLIGREMDFELNTPVAGQTWRTVLRRNGVVFATVYRTTNYRGDFEIERMAPDKLGTDAFGVRAVNQKTGQVRTAGIAI